MDLFSPKLSSCPFGEHLERLTPVKRFKLLVLKSVSSLVVPHIVELPWQDVGDMVHGSWFQPTGVLW